MLDLQTISDRIEIDDLITRYTRAVDQLDWALYDTVFTPDATIDYTASGGSSGPVVEVRRWLAEEAIPLFAQTQHLVGHNLKAHLAGEAALPSSQKRTYNTAISSDYRLGSARARVR